MVAAHGDRQALLISEHPKTGALLKQTFEKKGILRSVKTISHCKSAVAYLRRIGPYRHAPTPEIVFFDFSHPGDNCIERLQELACGKHLPAVPVIVFSSRASESYLDRIPDKSGNTGLFAPIDLEEFMRRFRSLDRERFMGAMRQLGSYGPIVVRLPATFVDSVDDYETRIA